jgi:hypothetical protein
VGELSLITNVTLLSTPHSLQGVEARRGELAAVALDTRWRRRSAVFWMYVDEPHEPAGVGQDARALDGQAGCKQGGTQEPSIALDLIPLLRILIECFLAAVYCHDVQ